MTTATSNTLSPLGDQLRSAASLWAQSQHELVILSAEFADSGEWAQDGAPTAAHWIADVADIDVSTAREWIRIGRLLRELPETATAFAERRLSYSKVRTLTRVANPENEAELVDIAVGVPAGHLGRALADWMNRNFDPDDLAAYQRQRRSITSRVEPDGMTVFTNRLEPLVAGLYGAVLDSLIMRGKAGTKSGESASADASAAPWPTLAQQRADALEQLLVGGVPGTADTEVIVHVRGDGCTLDDGTPINNSVVADLIPHSFIRVLIHDAERRPIDSSGRRRHPSTRQKRVVKERDQVCTECGTSYFLEYDHDPAWQETGRTTVDGLKLRCHRCHRKRHDEADGRDEEAA